MKLAVRSTGAHPWRRAHNLLAVGAVNMDQIDTHATAIAAQEVARLEPGATVELDADVTAFPTPFSQLKPGRDAATRTVIDSN